MKNPEKITAEINAIDGFVARLWDRVPGKERIYVEYGPKLNGGRRWHGGVGWTAYLDLSTETWKNESWAGAATRKAYLDRVSAMMEAYGAE
jgi:hypothetical protein